MVLEPERNRHALTHQVCKQGRDALITACLHSEFKLAKLFIQVSLIQFPQHAIQSFTMIDGSRDGRSMALM